MVLCSILAGCNSPGFYVISAGCHTIEVRMTLGIGQFLERKIRRNLIYALFSQCKSDDAGAPPYIPTSYDSLCSLNDHVNFFVSVVPFYSILREST